MRILLLSHYYPPEVNAPASRISEHARRWVEAGATVTVITCAPNCPTGIVFPGYENRFRRQIEELDGVRVVRVWTYVAPNAGIVRRIANYLSYLVSAVWAGVREPSHDVVVATSPQFFCGWAGVWTARLSRTPLVLEIRDLWPESMKAVGLRLPGLVYRFLEWLERRMYLAADRIVAVGDGYREGILARIGGTPREVDVVTNGVDVAALSPDGPGVARDFRSEWDLRDRFVCSYIGTIGMAHGLEVVLDAAELLRNRGRDDVAFVLVGEGAHRERLEREARARDLEDLVRFVGRQPRSSIRDALLASDCCLVHLRPTPLFETVIPSKIFEAMAMARPIVMGVRGAASDIVLGAGAGVSMEPGSAVSLVDAVTTLADDPEGRVAMGRAGRARVLSSYDREALAGRYLELLEGVVASPGALHR